VAPSARAGADKQLLSVRASFLTSDRTYGAPRVWHDLLVEGLAWAAISLSATGRLTCTPPASTNGVRPRGAFEARHRPNVLNRTFGAASANRKWVADFTYLWTAEG